ncbi:MAG: hypothetical protein HZC05_02485 [Candidatus Magasanikbacteria bacterium]|nr:hypothetical protein [Candidatus Magasanikbacteria bacterium]
MDIQHNEHAAPEHTSETPITPAPSDLEILKTQILAELQPQKTNRVPLAWGSLLVTIVLSILAVVSIVQAVQSAQILSKVKSGNFGAASAPASNLENLPNMVGGC